MRRQTLPTFDDPPVTQRDRDVALLAAVLPVIAACLAFAICALNVLGPEECSTQALTPECFDALVTP
jgi:hypothetical protein